MRGLIKRQKVLLALISELNKKGMGSKLGIEKGLFILKEEEKIEDFTKFYSFFPYKYGPYSYTSYRDMSKLKSEGYISEDEKTLTDKGLAVIKEVDSKTMAKIKRITERFNSDSQLKNYVYKKYPHYTQKSDLLKHKEEGKSSGIFTIGYEGEDIDSFLNLLIENKIDILIDIRNNPFSMNFSFTQKKLREYLEKSGIKYMHIPELGIKSELRKHLLSEQDYQNLFRHYEETTIQEQKDKIAEIIELSKTHRIALMCFERNKDMCHRGVLSRHLENQTISVIHI